MAFLDLSPSAKRRLPLAVLLLLGAMAVPLVLATQSAPPASALEARTGLPEVPRTDTPRFIGGSVTDQTVVGDRVIVVGTFEQVRDNDGTLVEQGYYAAYDIDTGELDLDASPTFDLPVLAVEPDGQGGVIVGGQFIRVDGSFQLRIARLDAGGELDRSFAARTSARVDALAVRGDRVYAGGPFVTPARGLTAFVLSDGSVDPNFDFPLAGPAGRGGELAVKALGVAGDDLVVVHSGLLVAEQSRVGVAIIDVSSVTSPTLRPWRTDFFKDNTTDVGGSLAITDGAVSPDGSYLVVVSAGGDRPLEGKDAAVRFPTTGNGVVEPDWVSRHFDSLFGVGISDQAVFIGGHFLFQEAPGSANPFPGDPNTNFGAGPSGQGPLVLGNDVVAREQIGALDPETGKSFNWNPGANAQIGVESIVVVERGLLVGQDGDRLGGQDVGRHGFFDATSVPDIELELTSSFDSHFSGEVVPLGEVTVSGFASDGDAGVERLQLAIRNRDTGQYVHPDGSLSRWIGINANLENQGANETAWSYPIDFLTPGNYRIQARTFTTDGRRDLSPPELDVVVRGDEIPLVERPRVAQAAGGVLTATGSVTDDLGVSSVTVRVLDRETGEILQADGSLGTADHRFDAEVSEVGAQNVTWTSTFTVPRDGRFSVEASAIDTSGQEDGRFVFRVVTVSTNDLPPTITFPAGTFETQPNQPFTLTPVFEDDLGLSTASVRISAFVTEEGPRADGSVAIPADEIFFDGVADQTLVNANYSSPALAAGTYTLEFRSEDFVGQTATVTRELVVGPIGDNRPEITITSDRNVEVSPAELTATGVATDDRGVDEVRVYIRDLDNGQWINSNGNRVNNPVAHTATVDNRGQQSTNWNFAFTVGTAGTYQVSVLSVDAGGQTSNAETAVFTHDPSNVVPQLTLTAPTQGQLFTDSIIAVNGRATDDNEIANVELQIRRDADGQFLRNNGTFGNAESLPAILSNPGREATNFTFFSRGLDTGDYTVTVQVTDNTNQTTEIQRSVTLSEIETPAPPPPAPAPPVGPVLGNPVNLSEGQPAIQSSTLRDDSRWAASAAVDGNTSGRNNNRSISHTATEFQPWWEVDLGAPSALSEIQIWNRTDSCCVTRLSNYSVFVSDQPMDGRTLAQLQADGSVTEYFFSSAAGRPTSIDAVGVVGQYVRIQLHGSNSLQMGEIVVLGNQ